MKRFFYRLGGTTYDVIKHCTPDTKTKYQNLALSLLLSTGLAAIGGFDIARQFTTALGICVCVSLIWALAVFFYDYFVINTTGGKVIFKYIRIPVGIANVFITVTALFVLLNQPTIDTTLSLSNAHKITQCDSSYLTARQDRYASISDKKRSIELYHQRNCVSEALNHYPGTIYNQKHALCVSTNLSITNEKAELDSAEKSYFAAYQLERTGLQKINNNDFFTKVLLLPDLVNRSVIISILAVCLFVFLVYLELQSIMLKFSIDTDDEYHLNLKIYSSNRRGLTSDKMHQDLSYEQHIILLNQKEKEEEIADMGFAADIKAADAKLLRILELQGKIDILRSKGQDEMADEYEKLLRKYSSDIEKTKKQSPEIFQMTQTMIYTVAEISKDSRPENLNENIFNWIVNNITYDQEHSKEHYRTARETFNEKRGVCGELSVLFIAMLRSVNTNCTFCEVTTDNTGKMVAHAAVLIKDLDNSRSFLSDIAYKTFEIKHIEYRELSDEELNIKYKNWNA